VILRGKNPAESAVLQLIKFDLMFDLKTAGTLDWTCHF
jgi:hypothetical protein